MKYKNLKKQFKKQNLKIKPHYIILQLKKLFENRFYISAILTIALFTFYIINNFNFVIIHKTKENKLRQTNTSNDIATIIHKTIKPKTKQELLLEKQIIELVNKGNIFLADQLLKKYDLTNEKIEKLIKKHVYDWYLNCLALMEIDEKKAKLILSKLLVLLKKSDPLYYKIKKILSK